MPFRTLKKHLQFINITCGLQVRGTLEVGELIDVLETKMDIQTMQVRSPFYIENTSVHRKGV